MHPHLPVNGLRALAHVQPAVHGAVGEVLVHQHALLALRAAAQQGDQVRVAGLGERLHLKLELTSRLVETATE